MLVFVIAIYVAILDHCLASELGDEGNISFTIVLILVIGTVSAVFLGASLTIIAHIKLSSLYKVNVRIPKEVKVLQAYIINSCYQTEPQTPFKHEVVVSRKIDAALNEIIERFLENKVLPWYSRIVKDSTPAVNSLRNVLWHSIAIVYERLSKMDQVHFVTCGILTCLTHHLEQIRVAEAVGEANGDRGVLHLVPQLSSPEKERNFLRLMSEYFIFKTFPIEYYQCQHLRIAMRELIACKVLEPMIDCICDPDWINQQLLSYLRQQQAAEELHKRTYMYAASYEDFIALIHDSSEIGDLKHLRRNIINEIMQATAINNLKKAKVVQEGSPHTTAKDGLHQARNLKRYINQLSYAKSQCERRIALLSQDKNVDEKLSEKAYCSDHFSDCDSEYYYQSFQDQLNTKVITFQVLLESAFARRHFAIYLDDIGQGALLSFWSSVQELKQSEKKLHYQLGVEIYHSFLHPQPAPIKVDKVTLRGVEAFLLGNRGPEVLYEIAEEIEKALEERHYMGFLSSSTYHAMLLQAQVQGVDFISELSDDCNGGGNAETVDSFQLTDHSTCARNKLALLQERLNNKLLALQAIRMNAKSDPKVISRLESEITTLRSEHKHLEAHVERTDLWSEHIGQWRVYVQNTQLGDEKETPNLFLLVHLNSESAKAIKSGDSFLLFDRLSSSTFPTNGWTVARKLSQIAELHRKLSLCACKADACGAGQVQREEYFPKFLPIKSQISPWVKNLEQPSFSSKILFGKSSEKIQLEKLRNTTQSYFDAVMTDERMSSSELIYSFLSPSPEYLKQPGEQPKKQKFSFSTLFKGGDSKGDSDEEDIGSLIGEVSCDSSGDVGDGGKDTVAEPLYTFLEELCDLRGVSKWLRKTLMSFVQITYGKNITKYVRETVSAMFSESMILYYLQSARDSFWPLNAEMQSPPQDRTEEEIIKTRQEAREQFINNLPVLLCTLVGQQNARKGALKLFATLQHHALNKNLFYKVFEDFVKELFPEIQERLEKNMKDLNK